MEAKFKFHEVVKVINTDFTNQKKIAGLIGVVLGMAEDEGGKWGYAVHIIDFEEVWDLNEEYLQGTGQVISEEEFYDGTFIKVKVDPETGEGSLED